MKKEKSLIKRFLLTLAAFIGMMGAWAQQDDGDEVPLTSKGTHKWELAMPESGVEMEVEYYENLPLATLTLTKRIEPQKSAD